MSTYIHFTEEQKQRAASVDLESFSAAGAKSSLPPAERNGWPVTIASPSAATSGTIMPRSGAATPSASCSGFITSAIRRR